MKKLFSTLVLSAAALAVSGTTAAQAAAGARPEPL